MRRPDSITGEVALVTGASRGLGLALARELARHSCPLVICARDSAELERAAQDLRNRGVDVVTVAGDITAAGMPQQLVDTAVERFGRLDILVNNAGIIQVGPVSSLTASDYETAVRAMALAPMQLALAALPVMRAQAHGRIVTITSIGGKVSVPHLMPYAMAKFAAVGFSEGLRAELGSHPVSVTTIVPGLMRTGSHLNALFAGRKNAEFTWFGVAASLPFLSMDAGRAAQQIIAAAAARRAELILTPAGQLVARTGAIAPGLTAAILHAVNQLVLPRADGESSRTAPGHRLRPLISPAVFDWLTALGRRAAGRLNENPAPAASGLPPGPA
jgi:short-subunit dehydrogenase